ncbi:MAG: hypothetical protein A2096_00610 [Spirochaetes bacterium GWF1_41_5]|nr:MAG: hypothetical protein A2096_00610 [Spirochaetes bacterium GWF1_41_5]
MKSLTDKPRGFVTFSYFTAQKELLGIFEEIIKKKYKTDIYILDEYKVDDFTEYYSAEMGKPLWKKIICLKKDFFQENLFKIKLWTTKIEKKYSKRIQRQINIDPGFLLLENFILLTNKRFSHRIYLGKGVFGDLELIYKAGKYNPLSWTYPDYKSRHVLDFLEDCRKKLYDVINQSRINGIKNILKF